MRILALDTATSATAVAVGRDGESVEERDEVPDGARPHHATHLLPLIARALERAGLGFAELDLLACGLGPGTFTGLRIGLATARGLALANGTPLVGVETLRALAEPVGGPALAVIDARRGELFVAAYDTDRALLDARAVALEDLDAALAPAVEAGCLAVGEGAVRFRSNLEQAGVAVAPSGSPLHSVSAATICRLVADGRQDRTRPVAPIYLRLPDAEIALQERNP